MSLPSSAFEPLHQHGRLRTDDVDLAQAVVSEVYEPHVLEPRGERRLDARLNAVQNGSLTLGYLTYGVGATITLPPSEHWYHVNITLLGGSRVSRGDSVRGETTAMAGAAMLVPHHLQTIEWDSDTAQFALRVPRVDLEGHLGNLTRTRIVDPVDFDLVVDLNSAAGRGLIRCIEFIRSEWDDEGILTRYDNSRRHLESLTLTNLVLAAGGPHRELLDQPFAPDVPEALQRAVDYVHDHARTLPTLADLTVAAGASARTLQNQFLRHFDRSPLQYIRDVRLRGVRDDLLHPSAPEVTVTDVATAWGFYNLGRFSSLYREAYGESPSETLRRCRS
ncbi:AraC family transcriptional regulator [Rhodococcus sp. TAF43]|uniref:AraC family transcriptional regulator n=1 Tax=unclassified Rhodococcus (in: high G+C Gram-positive bacteria) TaxID=192944 RepID=UPI0020C674D4|nr:AraC family transcriptional regulator [Rhodococcus sp. W8901]